MDDLSEVFASRSRALVIAPGGCGKTEIIAKAVACPQDGRQLILTHTHAGVKSLRDRLREYGVSSRSYSIGTIAGFALKYAISFPKSSGLSEFLPSEHDWRTVYPAGTRVLSSRVGRRIIGASYTGLYVDEYQDCTVIQHKLIMSLADVLPCRIVGDPLQGIFGFGGNVLIDWFQDIFPHFERLPDPRVPWRWHDNNEPLGNWLLKVRDWLLRGDPVDMRSAPPGAVWMPLSDRPIVDQRKACFRVLTEPGSAVAIHSVPQRAHYLARCLRGRYTSMEEVESKTLLKWCGDLERCRNTERAVAVLRFAFLCMTELSTKLRTIRKRVEAGDQDIAKGLQKHRGIALALDEVVTGEGLGSVLHAFLLMEETPGCILYRRELWLDMKRAIKEYEKGDHDTLQDAAWAVRDRGRIWGRRVEHRTVSRTLLIKGLEFDHAIVLNADDLDAKELYVAMTRGSKSLTVLSSRPVLLKSKPVFGSQP